MALIGPVGGDRHATHTLRYPLIPEKMLRGEIARARLDVDPGAMLYRYTARQS